jgi:hypothetical protein
MDLQQIEKPVPPDLLQNRILRHPDTVFAPQTTIESNS